MHLMYASISDGMCNLGSENSFVPDNTRNAVWYLKMAVVVFSICHVQILQYMMMLLAECGSYSLIVQHGQMILLDLHVMPFSLFATHQKDEVEDGRHFF